MFTERMKAIYALLIKTAIILVNELSTLSVSSATSILQVNTCYSYKTLVKGSVLHYTLLATEDCGGAYSTNIHTVVM